MTSETTSGTGIPAGLGGVVIESSPTLVESRRPRTSRETTRIAGQLPPDGLAEVFDAAAGKVERYASQFSRWTLPWYATPEGLADEDIPPSEWDADDWEIRVQPSPISDDAPEPEDFDLSVHGALPMVGGFIADEIPPSVARWVSTTGPQIAGPLVAMFREAAARVRAGRTADTDAMLRCVAELALEIVHEEDPRDDG